MFAIEEKNNRLPMQSDADPDNARMQRDIARRLAGCTRRFSVHHRSFLLVARPSALHLGLSCAREGNQTPVYQVLHREGKPGETRNASRLQKGEAAIWQRRYGEHVIWGEAVNE